ncbi:hypothetical protein ACPDHL_04565 [Myroides sp. C15-4]|uniref:hypothetical protein n=1 Tax=Myroides sp. C15-4 TaxID=3400532 RepID=UPI003D2F64CF
MKTQYFFPLVLVAVALTHCTNKSKETQEPQRIKLEQPASTNATQPVQIPMHATKENSSSGLTSFKIKEEMKQEMQENAREKNAIEE